MIHPGFHDVYEDMLHVYVESKMDNYIFIYIFNVIYM